MTLLPGVKKNQEARNQGYTCELGVFRPTFSRRWEKNLRARISKEWGRDFLFFDPLLDPGAWPGLTTLSNEHDEFYD